jgi:hypothetical protein
MLGRDGCEVDDGGLGRVGAYSSNGCSGRASGHRLAYWLFAICTRSFWDFPLELHVMEQQSRSANRRTTQGGVMRRLLVVGASVAMLATGPGGAFAGEVKGPPGTLNNTNETGALNHANSACAASGLNDFDLSDPDGQTASQVQTAADSWKFYGLPKGSPGTLGLCKGGTGQRG